MTLEDKIKALGRPPAAIRDEQARAFLAGLDVETVKQMGDRLALDFHDQSKDPSSAPR